MPDKKADGDLDFGFGSVSRHDGTVDSQAKPLQDRVIGDGDTFMAPPPEAILSQANLQGIVGPPPSLPVNRATMECMRGPCRYFWVLTSRFDAQSDRINLARTRQCNCHVEPTPLNEENIFHCSMWWPSSLSFVPESLRPLLRPRLRAAWEFFLRKRGYNFDWKFWSDDVFESDRPEQRRQTRLGMSPATFLHEAVGKKRAPEEEVGGMKETEDGVFWGKS